MKSKRKTYMPQLPNHFFTFSFLISDSLCSTLNCMHFKNKLKVTWQTSCVPQKAVLFLPKFVNTDDRLCMACRWWYKESMGEQEYETVWQTMYYNLCYIGFNSRGWRGHITLNIVTGGVCIGKSSSEFNLCSLYMVEIKRNDSFLSLIMHRKQLVAGKLQTIWKSLQGMSGNVIMHWCHCSI